VSQAANEKELEGLILGYLKDCPDAEDTLEGISEWWVLDQLIKHRTQHVQKVLESLVAQGLLSEERGPDGRKRYRNIRGAD
jgi:hypothetical protein